MNTPSLKTIKPEPECTLEEKREQLRRSLCVASFDNTFESFKPIVGTTKALSAFKALASGTTDWKMLLCYGGVGNGKTHLCEATAISLYKSGIFCRVLNMAGIMRALKNSMRHDALTNYDEILDRLCCCEHLIIDDVGMGGSGSDWEFGQLEEIVVTRYLERLFTIFTTNLDIKFDPQYPERKFIPERVVSRFGDPDIGRVILNSGEDFRPKKKAKQGGQR